VNVSIPLGALLEIQEWDRELEEARRTAMQDPKKIAAAREMISIHREARRLDAGR